MCGHVCVEVHVDMLNILFITFPCVVLTFAVDGVNENDLFIFEYMEYTKLVVFVICHQLLEYD